MTDGVAGRPAAFTDTHVHFWDHSVEGLQWAWLEPGYPHPRLKDMHLLDAPRFTAAELRAEADDAAPTRVVHVQSAAPLDAPERETAWLQALADRDGWPDAIVGACRLADEGAPAVLAAHAIHPRFAGVRDLAAATSLEHPQFARGLSAVAAAGVSAEVMVDWPRFSMLARLTAAEPDVTVVLGHCGMPVERSPAYFAAWEPALRQLAAVPNIVCKISALAGSADPQWTTTSIRPWFLACIDAFGPDRCMLGTNWPVDRLHTSYDRLVDAYRVIASDLTPGEQYAVFAGTAGRVYRLDALA